MSVALTPAPWTRGVPGTEGGGTGVGVGVGVSVGVGVGVGVGVDIGVGVRVGVSVGVGVGLGTGVGVKVGVGVGISVGVGMGVCIGIGVTVGVALAANVGAGEGAGLVQAGTSARVRSGSTHRTKIRTLIRLRSGADLRGSIARNLCHPLLPRTPPMPLPCSCARSVRRRRSAPATNEVVPNVAECCTCKNEASAAHSWRPSAHECVPGNIRAHLSYEPFAIRPSCDTQSNIAQGW